MQQEFLRLSEELKELRALVTSKHSPEAAARALAGAARADRFAIGQRQPDGSYRQGVGDRPPCSELRKLPGLEKGWFLSRDPGWWHIQPDGTRQFDLDRCRLKRFTHAEALSCLKNKPMVWIGDSITRYQYMAMAFFLHFGRWPAGLAEWKEHIGIGSVAWEGAWRNWHRFYVDVPAAFNGTEWCDCYRGKLIGNGANNEHRMYYNPETGVKLSFVFQWGKMHIPGHFPPTFDPKKKPGLMYANEAECGCRQPVGSACLPHDNSTTARRPEPDAPVRLQRHADRVLFEPRHAAVAERHEDHSVEHGPDEHVGRERDACLARLRLQLYRGAWRLPCLRHNQRATHVVRSQREERVQHRRNAVRKSA
jgi:hypothetical protein